MALFTYIIDVKNRKWDVLISANICMKLVLDDYVHTLSFALPTNIAIFNQLNNSNANLLQRVESTSIFLFP